MTPCIEHNGCRNHSGYGLVYHGEPGQRKQVLAHRVAYCEHNNVTLASIEGLVVRHDCDNPPCKNGEHLLLGTHADNVEDKMSRGRHRGGDFNGERSALSKLTAAQVATIRERYKPRCKVNGGKALAAEFGVEQQTVSMLVTNRTWKEAP